jgi:aminoglycoside phosphotransferase (APT) family kinase protein
MALRQTELDCAPLAEAQGRRFQAGTHEPVGLRSPAEVAATLADCLGRRLHCTGLDFLQPPVEVSGGWETYTYSFQLKAHPALPKAYAQPLILRAYSCCEGLDRSRYEFAVQRHLGGIGYPVPGHLFLEESCDYFGGPFLVSPWIQGPTLLRSALDKPWLVCNHALRMADAQLRLHRLPAQGFPRRTGDFLSTTLGWVARAVGRCRLHELRPGLEWLCAHRPPAPRRPSILHLDFHPLNLLDDGAGGLIVIDWTEADVGDPHADVAQTLLNLECMTEDHPSWYDRFWTAMGRWLFNRTYLRAYDSQAPLADARLRYYRALAAFRRLCLYGHWLTVGPTMQGRKPGAIRHLQVDHFHVLERYFRKWSGVSVALVPPQGVLLPEPVLL